MPIKIFYITRPPSRAVVAIVNIYIYDRGDENILQLPPLLLLMMKEKKMMMMMMSPGKCLSCLKKKK